MSSSNSSWDDPFWAAHVHDWHFRTASDMAFSFNGIKPLSEIDVLDIDQAAADALSELGHNHPVSLKNASLKIFKIRFFFDKDNGICSLIQPQKPYRSDFAIYGLEATFVTNNDRIACGLSVDESNSDSGGIAEVALFNFLSFGDSEYDVFPISFNRYGTYCTDVDTAWEVGYWLANLFAGVQYRFLHRPEVIRILHHRISKEERQIAERKNKHVRIVKVQRVIKIFADGEALVQSNRHHQITLPVWGVCGHWRQYKSGKRVWISPYKKGKERNNPDIYHSKIYQFTEVPK